MSMRNILITLLVFVPFLTYSQNNETPKSTNSKIEKLLTEEGLVIKKDFNKLLSLGPIYNTIEFSKLVVTDLKSKQQSKGIYIYTYVGGGTTLAQSASCYIDDNKVLGLIEFLELASEKLQNQEANAVEYIFNLDNLKVNLFNSNRNPSKVFAKEEESYNYWFLTFDVGRIRNASYKIQNVEDVVKIINVLKGVDFK